MEKILLDVVTDSPIERNDYTLPDKSETNERYKKYHDKKYIPQKHEAMPEDYKLS